jgi:hypothetical protein
MLNDELKLPAPMPKLNSTGEPKASHSSDAVLDCASVYYYYYYYYYNYDCIMIAPTLFFIYSSYLDVIWWQCLQADSQELRFPCCCLGVVWWQCLQADSQELRFPCCCLGVVWWRGLSK